MKLCSDCIIDKNARIGKDVVIANSEVQYLYLLPLKLPYIFWTWSLKDRVCNCGSDCSILCLDLQGVQEADRSSEGFYIRSGITVILKNSTIIDGLKI